MDKYCKVIDVYEENKYECTPEVLAYRICFYTDDNDNENTYIKGNKPRFINSKFCGESEEDIIAFLDGCMCTKGMVTKYVVSYKWIEID